jgi:hypothetical protein
MHSGYEKSPDYGGGGPLGRRGWLVIADIVAVIAFLIFRGLA